MSTYRNKIKKKKYYIFLLITMGLVMIFSMVDEETDFEKEIAQLTDVKFSPTYNITKCGSTMHFDDQTLYANQTIYAVAKVNKTKILERNHINYTNILHTGIWFRDVQNDQDMGALLPADPCFYRDYNFVNKTSLYPDSTSSAKHWQTGVVLHRVGNIDTVAGTYDMKFQYFIEVFEDDKETDFTKKKPTIDFINMVGKPILFEESKGFIQSESYYDVTVSGKFFTDIDFQQFPFEKLKLSIITEPSYDKNSTSTFGYKNSKSDSIQFHVWPYYGLLYPDIPSPGYEIVSYNFTTSDFKVDQGTEYSRFKANYMVQRQPLDSFFKFIFPVFVMTSLAFSSLLYPSEQYMTKISLNALFLLGILLFVQTVQEKIANPGALTVFDYVVMSSYGILVVTIVIPALKWKRQKEYEDDKETRKHWIDTDRRNHDLNLENLRRTEADIIFFKDKLNQDVVKGLNERRQCLDTLKNIDSRISLYASSRNILTAEQVDDKKIKEYISEQQLKKIGYPCDEGRYIPPPVEYDLPDEGSKLLDPEITNKEKSDEENKKDPKGSATGKIIFSFDEIRFMVDNFVNIDHLKQLSENEKIHLTDVREEIRSYNELLDNKKIQGIIEKNLKSKKLSSNDREKLRDIIEEILSNLSQDEKENLTKIRKELYDYDKIVKQHGVKTALQKQPGLLVQRRLANTAWNKYGDTIKKEIMLKILDKGAIEQIIDLQLKRKSYVEKLKVLELKTKDENDEMIIGERQILTAEIRHAISKNEMDEISSIKKHNTKLNKVSYVIIGAVILVGFFLSRSLF